MILNVPVIIPRQRRLEIYAEILAELEPGNGFCSTLSLVLTEPDYRVINGQGLDAFPELVKHRPQENTGPYWTYWFPLSIDGHEKRIDILTTILAEMLTTPSNNEADHLAIALAG